MVPMLFERGKVSPATTQQILSELLLCLGILHLCAA